MENKEDSIWGKLDNTDMDTLFWDDSEPIERRLDWLIENLTIDEKLTLLSSIGADIPRLGIRGTYLGGEAAHGVVERNDLDESGKPDITTSFPQPIGMSSTWDIEAIRKAGEIVGTEARVIYHRHPDGGLSRWAPTVDLERDPRWGRNEEGYGEDPVLTGAMASSYIKGMQGDDPRYLRCAATLKHFYANNTENGRGWKNSSIDSRNMYEFYLEPFRRAIMDGHAEAVMTAYNRINGTPGILNPQVQSILKDKFGLHGHVVSDGGAMALVARLHHYYGTHAETIAGALHAGVDAMSDPADEVNRAAKEAYELGIITEEEVDTAIRNTFRTRLRLGIYDRNNRNPYDRVTEADIDTPGTREFCRKFTQESVVLLKNDKGILPLQEKDLDGLTLVGPVSDVSFNDWYGGVPPYRKTLRDGIEELSGRKYEAFDAWDRVRLRINDREVYIRDDNTAALAPGGKTGDTFVMEDWGYGSILFRSERTGRYLQSRQYHTDKAPESRGRLTADRNSALDWFVMEIFHLETEKDGATRLTNRFHVPVCVREDGSLYADINGVPADIHVDIVSDGIEQAVSAAKKAETVVFALGCNPMVNAKEEIDRASIALPLHEQRLLEAVRSASKRVIVVMLSNYPYSMNGAEKDVDAMLWSASGSEEMGTALADILFGKVSPSGRLNQTWYRSDDDLPDINDYDIIRGHRTYRYYDGEVIFPFGYGLSYTTFKWSDLDVTLADRTMINVTLTVANTGSFISDEVVEIYCRAPEGRVPRPSRQLIAFTRVKDLLPGEKRIVSLNVPTRELEYYDTISNSMILVEGNYRFFAGHSSADETLTVSLFVPGVQTGCRDLSKRYRADSYDDYENVELLEGHFGFTSVSPRNITAPCTITLRDCHFKSIWKKCYILLKAEKRCEVNVLADGKCIATFRGDTGSYTEEAVFRENSLKEGDPQPDRWPAVYQEVELMCDTLPDKNEGTLTIEIKGDARICWFRFD